MEGEGDERWARHAAKDVVIEDSLPDDVSLIEGSLDVPSNVTCVGGRCTILSLAAGASVTGRFVTTVDGSRHEDEHR